MLEPEYIRIFIFHKFIGWCWGKPFCSAVFRVLKKIYQLYQNKNGTSGKENEFYIRYGVVPPNLVKQECSVNELRK